MKILNRKTSQLIAAACVIGWACASAQAQSPPANLSPGLQEVVKLSQAHMNEDVILSYIKNSGAAYNLSADDILYLNSQGISQNIISALLQNKGTAPAPAPTTTAVAPVPPSVPPPGYTPAVPSTPAPPAYPTATVAPPPPGSGEVNYDYFHAQLAPYGTWMDIPGYGTCWVPSEASRVPGWRPYANDGHWTYSEDGWYWQSDYPWGDIAFHYGRWFRDPRVGWAWVPGYNWGPAWVCWRNAEADGFCGWAPLPPGAVFEPGVGLMWNGRLAMDIDFGLGPDAFTFVAFDHFWDHNLGLFIAPPWRLPGLFRASIVLNNYRFVNGRFFIDGIGHDRIARFTHHDVRAEHIEFHDAHISRDRDFRGHELDHGRGGGFFHDHEH